MARESHTTIAPSTRQGTLPLGENDLNEGPPNGTSRSSNSMPRSRISTQGRSDHDE
jgi:hypothetical protein